MIYTFLDCYEVFYDSESDILYIQPKECRDVTCMELDENTILELDETESMVGLEILWALERGLEGEGVFIDLSQIKNPILTI